MEQETRGAILDHLWAYVREAVAWAVTAFLAFYGLIPLPFSSLEEILAPPILWPAILIGPAVSRLLLGFYPASFVLDRFARSITLRRLEAETSAAEPAAVEEAEVDGLPPAPVGSRTLLRHLVKESSELSVKLFNRAAVYMLVGVAIAFLGLGVFWALTGGDPGQDASSLVERLPGLAARFGILFFIESIAFFMLRQYRVAMDEFRHFHQVARMREDSLAVLILAEERNEPVEFDALVGACGFFREAGRLNQGETTELLEATKGATDDLKLIERVLDLLAARVK